MSISRIRSGLVLMFATGFILQTIALISVYLRDLTRQEELISMLLKLLAIYSVHWGVIAGGIFARTPQENEQAPALPARLALVSSAFWNLLLVWRPVAYALKPGSPKEVSAYLDGVAAASSFLVAGALAYFFAQREE
jgi:polyferredoxin